MCAFRDDPQPHELEIWLDCGREPPTWRRRSATTRRGTSWPPAGVWPTPAKPEPCPHSPPALRSLGDSHLYAGEFAAAGPLLRCAVPSRSRRRAGRYRRALQRHGACRRLAGRRGPCPFADLEHHHGVGPGRRHRDSRRPLDERSCCTTAWVNTRRPHGRGSGCPCTTSGTGAGPPRRANWAVVAADRGGRPQRARPPAVEAFPRGSRQGPAAPAGRCGIEARSRALISDLRTWPNRCILEAIDRWAGPFRSRTPPGPTFCTASGCAASVAASTPATSSARAHDLLTVLGAHAFAERAAPRARATGETARKRTAATEDHLTPHEVQIARSASGPVESRDR